MTAKAAMPPMGELKIGPGGQTFDQLKQDVLSKRDAFKTALLRSDMSGDELDAYNAAVRLLEAAYVRVGLPYVAP